MWDDVLRGFGVRVRPSGAMSYVVVCRAGTGRKAPLRKVTLGSVGKLTPDIARGLAKKALGAVARGKDPAAELAERREATTVKDLVEALLTEHVRLKLKPTTARRYEHLLNGALVAEVGKKRADGLTRAALARVHANMKETPVSANRMLNAVSSMYAFAQGKGVVPDGYNPAAKIARHGESRASAS